MPKRVRSSNDGDQPTDPGVAHLWCHAGQAVGEDGRQQVLQEGGCCGWPALEAGPQVLPQSIRPAHQQAAADCSVCQPLHRCAAAGCCAVTCYTAAGCAGVCAARLLCAALLLCLLLLLLLLGLLLGKLLVHQGTQNGEQLPLHLGRRRRLAVGRPRRLWHRKLPVAGRCCCARGRLVDSHRRQQRRGQLLVRHQGRQALLPAQ